jgi:glucan biosynthesis protein C
VFVIHSQVLLCVALTLRDVGLHAMLKFTLLAPIVLVLCFALAWALRRLPGVRRVL